MLKLLRLEYDAESHQYIYVWKTDKSWAGTCRQLIVRLSDGSEHKANFKSQLALTEDEHAVDMPVFAG